jgi:SAM-dependent methyltransferase
LAAFYRETRFNPVHISVEQATIWQSHVAKRCNLCERHLGIPLRFLGGRNILSFGCNSGENELVLATAGAKLTLVEPNEQVHPRLRALFQQFGLQERLTAVLHADVESFASSQLYDLVLAEGFLHTVPNRDEMLLKIARLLAPGGFGVISFLDRFGILLELTRRMLLWRACQLAGVKDVFSDQCLDLAKKLYGEDFARLSASRTFEAWWKDTLVIPFVGPQYLWSYPEMLVLVERAGCEFHSSSPRWALVDHFDWYKNRNTLASRHQRVLEDFRTMLPFFLSGLPPSRQDPPSATDGVLEAVAGLIQSIGDFALDPAASIDRVSFPAVLSDYLTEGTGPRWQQFAAELQCLYEAAHGDVLDQLLAAYAQSEGLRRLWGTPYHYLCFTRPVGVGQELTKRRSLFEESLQAHRV